MFPHNHRPAGKPRRLSLFMEQLEDRLTPAATAVFNTGVLSVVGDASANNILIGVDASGKLAVFADNEKLSIQSVVGTPNRASLTSILVDGGAGNDNIVLGGSLETLDGSGDLAFAPDAVLLGGPGNDTFAVLMGGFVGGTPAQGAPIPPIVGNVVQMGGPGNDRLDSGPGNDILLGGPGNDTLQWDPFNCFDQWSGGPGIDTAVVQGNDSFTPDFLTPDLTDVSNADRFLIIQDPSHPGSVKLQRINLLPFYITMKSMEKVVLRGGAGNDSIGIGTLAGTAVRRVVVEGNDGNDIIDGSAQARASIALTLLGDDGNDVLLGGAGGDLLKGGADNDEFDPRAGADRVLGGAGNDVMTGIADRKQDTFIGGSGADTLKRAPGEPDVFVDRRPSEGDLVQPL